MTNLLEIDLNEPTDAITTLAPAYPIRPYKLNVDGWADYRWVKFDGIYKHVERKTWGEILSSVDRVEEQLQRHLEKQPDAELVFLLEGTLTITSKGKVLPYYTNRTSNGRDFRQSINGLYAWLYQLGKYMEIVSTAGQRESWAAIGAMYANDQKESHSTLQRTINKPINISRDGIARILGTTSGNVTDEFAAGVRTIMAANTGIGERLAVALIAEFGSPYNVWTVEPWERLTLVPGIGKATARKILSHVGRTIER